MPRPLSDDDLRVLWETIGRGGGYAPASAEQLGGLMEQAAAKLELAYPDHPAAWAELAATVALCRLGPRERPPPEPVRASLVALVEQLGGSRLDRTLDLSIAYGCGWQRPAVANATGWDGRWDRALNALRDLVERFVADGYRRLLQLGIAFPYEPDLAGAADLLLIRLCRPLSPLQIQRNEALAIASTETDVHVSAAAHEERVPPGAKAVYSVRPNAGEPARLWRNAVGQTLAVPDGAVIRVTAMDYETRITLVAGSTETTLKLGVSDDVRLTGPAELDIWECTCGHRRCAERHRLAGWDPGRPEQNLANFVASAVKGPGRVVKTGSFTQGMLFALWAREGFWWHACAWPKWSTAAAGPARGTIRDRSASIAVSGPRC